MAAEDVGASTVDVTDEPADDKEDGVSDGVPESDDEEDDDGDDDDNEEEEDEDAQFRRDMAGGDEGESAKAAGDAKAEAEDAKAEMEDILDAANPMDALVAEDDAEDDEDDEDGKGGDDADGEDGDNDDGGGDEQADGANAADGADAADGAGDGGVDKKRKGGKPKDPHAPKRPMLPCHVHNAEARARIAAATPGMDLAALGKALKADWEAAPQSRKDELQATYDREKPIYDTALAAYKKTPEWAKAEKEMSAWKDMRELKKIAKKHKKAAPKKPPSGYMSFCNEQRPEFAGTGKTSGEVASIFSERWKALSAKEQDAYNQATKVGKERWAVEMDEYRRSDKYKELVDEQVAIEVKQGLRNLTAEYAEKMPTKPQQAVQVWAKETGEKGGFVLLNPKFKALPEVERKPYLDRVDKARLDYKEAMTKFWESKDGVLFKKLSMSLKHKAAIRGAKSKFLVDAPKRPPAPLGLFVENKRLELEEAGSELKGFAIAKHASDLWKQMDEESRKVYIQKNELLVAEFQKQVAVFRETDAYKEFVRVQSNPQMLKAGARGKASGARGKAKAQKAKEKELARAKRYEVQRPASMPEKPANAFLIFCNERKEAGKPSSRSDFSALPAEERERLQKAEQALKTAFEAATMKFYNSKEGKKYTRLLDSAKRRKATSDARIKMQVDAPKPAQSAMNIYRSANGGSMAMWVALPAEDKKKWEDAHVKEKEEYEKKMVEFRKTDSFKKFEKVAQQKPKSSTVAATPGSKPPTQKAENAFQLFAKATKIRGEDASALQRRWTELNTEEKQKYAAAADVAAKKVAEEYARWASSAEGKQHLRAQASAKKKAVVDKAKQTFLTGGAAPEEPKRPKSALLLFAEERKAECVGLGAMDARKKMQASWITLGPEKQKFYMDKAKALLEVYEFEMDEYKDTPAYQAYARATKKADKDMKKGVKRESPASKPSGRGGGGGRGQGKKRKKAGASDSDEMGSDSSSSSTD